MTLSHIIALLCGSSKLETWPPLLYGIRLGNPYLWNGTLCPYSSIIANNLSSPHSQGKNQHDVHMVAFHLVLLQVDVQWWFWMLTFLKVTIWCCWSIKWVKISISFFSSWLQFVLGVWNQTTSSRGIRRLLLTNSKVGHYFSVDCVRIMAPPLLQFRLKVISFVFQLIRELIIFLPLVVSNSQ